MNETILSVSDLQTHLHTDDGLVRAVDGLSFEVGRNETVCLVGESGSGKTMACNTIMGMVDPPADISGEVRFEGENLLGLSESELTSIRGNRISYLFQNAQNALDPVYTVGDQIAEAITFHQDVTSEQARERAVDLLGTVGLSRPAERVDEYPHELSDGMCQRVAIAIALAAEPDLLIADEPVSALDVMIQGRIIDLLDDLRRERDFSLVLVTHDLRVVASLADRMVVLYGGTDVERGATADVLQTPAHPYSQDLFASFTGDGERGDDLATRDPIPPQGCRFHRECAHAVDDCRDSKPPFAAVEGDDAHRVSCVHYGPERDPGEILFEARQAGAAFEADPTETPKQTAETDGGDSHD